MPNKPDRPHELVGKVFGGKRARQLGLTSRQLQSPNWCHLLRNAYADKELMQSKDEHILRAVAASLIIPTEAVIGGLSAAALYGICLLSPGAPVEIVVPRRRRFGPIKGLRLYQGDLFDSDIERQPIRHTHPARTAWDIARRHPVVDAVAALDAMISARLVRLSELDSLLLKPRVWRRKQAAQVIALLDPHAESPQESRVRARLMLAGLPKPEAQYNIRHNGTFIARVDLAWPKERVAVEYDGQWHANASQLRKDRQRLNRILGVGWHVIHVTDVHLAYHMDEITQQVTAALARVGN